MDLGTIKNEHIGWIRNSQRLLNSLNVGYMLSDRKNVILEVNDAMTRISGFKREDWIGHRIDEFFSESELEQIRHIEKRVGEFEDIDEFYQYELWARNASGELIPHLASISANFDENRCWLITFYTLSNIGSGNMATIEVGRPSAGIFRPISG